MFIVWQGLIEQGQQVCCYCCCYCFCRCCYYYFGLFSFIYYEKKKKNLKGIACLMYFGDFGFADATALAQVSFPLFLIIISLPSISHHPFFYFVFVLFYFSGSASNYFTNRFFFTIFEGFGGCIGKKKKRKMNQKIKINYQSFLHLKYKNKLKKKQVIFYLKIKKSFAFLSTT